MRLSVLQCGVVGLLLAASACEYVDRWRAPAEEAAAGGGLALSLEAPGVIRLGEEEMVRLSVSNRGDTVMHGVHAELLIPEWMEPVMPEPSGREVTMSSTPDEGTRLSYRMDDPPLQPGETQSVTQRIRAPLVGGTAEGALPWSRVVRARLVGPGGQPLGAEVESEIAIDTSGMGEQRMADGLPGDTLRGGDADTIALIERDRVGPIRTGMSVGAVRQAAPGARDTTWAQEGTRERAVVVPLEQGRQVTALIEGDVVTRIHVRDRALRTREGLGVGSRLEELRAAYGRTCADVGEGRVVVWFERAPEISFALDAPAQNAAQIREQPERIPGTATVRELWVRRSAARCP